MDSSNAIGATAPDLADAQPIFLEFTGLLADYWVLHGEFGTSPLFEAASFELAKVEELQRKAEGLVKDITAKKEAHNHAFKYDQIKSHFEGLKKDLTALRIRLEGPTWYCYELGVAYEVIGNQPNSCQTGPFPVSVSPPRRLTHGPVDSYVAPQQSMKRHDGGTGTRVAMSNGLEDLRASIRPDDVVPGSKKSFAFAATASRATSLVPSFAPINPIPLGRQPVISSKDLQIATRDQEIARCEFNVVLIMSRCTFIPIFRVRLIFYPLLTNSSVNERSLIHLTHSETISRRDP